MEHSFFVFVWAVDRANLTITHFVQVEPPPLKSINPVYVRFMKHQNGLMISIQDCQNFFGKMFDRPDRERSRDESQTKKPNELQYRYIEPEDRRFQHCSQSTERSIQNNIFILPSREEEPKELHTSEPIKHY